MTGIIIIGIIVDVAGFMVGVAGFMVGVAGFMVGVAGFVVGVAGFMVDGVGFVVAAVVFGGCDGGIWNAIFCIMPLSSCSRMWQWNTVSPAMTGFVKSTSH